MGADNMEKRARQAGQGRKDDRAASEEVATQPRGRLWKLSGERAKERKPDKRREVCAGRVDERPGDNNNEQISPRPAHAPM